MIGPLELVLTVSAIAAGGAVGIAWFVTARGREPSPHDGRAPLPVIPLLLSLVPVLSAVPVGLVVGGVLCEILLKTVPPSGAEFVVSHPGLVSPALHLRGAALMAVWTALPGLLGAGRILVSFERSWRGSLLLGAVAWVGFGAGLAAGAAIVAPLTSGLLAGPFPDAAISPEALVSPVLGGMAVFGVAASSGSVAWVLAASSPRALRGTLLWTAAMPAGALLVAAVTTPPDPFSQLVAAILIGGSWLAGLGAGALTARLRRRN